MAKNKSSKKLKPETFAKKIKELIKNQYETEDYVLVVNSENNDGNISIDVFRGFKELQPLIGALEMTKSSIISNSHFNDLLVLDP